jgi:DNA polymerase-3 subunit delta'
MSIPISALAAENLSINKGSVLWIDQTAGARHEITDIGVTLSDVSLERPIKLAFSAQLAQHKDRVPDLLDMLKTWIRDLAIRPYQPGRIINRDVEHLIDAVRSDMDEARLLDLWDAIEKAQKDLAANANLGLALDVMALRMAGLTDWPQRRKDVSG